MTDKPVSYQQLTHLLEKNSDLLCKSLGLTEAIFMIPTDGEGLRIRVSAIEGECDPGTKKMAIEVPNEEPLNVIFEIVDDYEPMKPLVKFNPPLGEKEEEPSEGE